MSNTLTLEDLQALARKLKQAGDPNGERLARVLRDRGRTRVAARRVIEALPDEQLAHESVAELLEFLQPWPSCSVTPHAT